MGLPCLRWPGWKAGGDVATTGVRGSRLGGAPHTSWHLDTHAGAEGMLEGRGDEGVTWQRKVDGVAAELPRNKPSG